MAQATKTTTADIHEQYSDFYRIAGGLSLVIIGIWIGSILFTDGYATNVYTELLSVVATILVLDQINQFRDRRALKDRLLNEVRSPAHGTAVTALEYLRNNNWLEADTFKGANLEHVSWNGAYIGGLDFTGANLESARLIGITNQHKNNEYVETGAVTFTNAYLPNAHLTSSVLVKIDLSNSNLVDAVVDNATLWRCKLEGITAFNTNFCHTTLTGSDLRNAQFDNAKFNNATMIRCIFDGSELSHAQFRASNLSHSDFLVCNLDSTDFKQAQLNDTNFTGAILTNAILRETILTGINLHGASLKGVIFDDATFVTNARKSPVILPDGSAWTPNTDMDKFTNPQHPDYAKTLETINQIRAEMGINPIE